MLPRPEPMKLRRVCRDVFAYLGKRQARGGLSGVSDIVPALATVGVHYRSEQVAQHPSHPTLFQPKCAKPPWPSPEFSTTTSWRSL